MGDVSARLLAHGRLRPRLRVFNYFLISFDIAVGDITDAAKKAVDASVAVVVPLPFLTGEYNMFIPLLIVHVFAVLAVIIDLPVLCLVHAYLLL